MGEISVNEVRFWGAGMSMETILSRSPTAIGRKDFGPASRARLLDVATIGWIGLILSITLPRSLPALPRHFTTAAEGIGVAACLVLIIPRTRLRPCSDERLLVRWLLAVPLSAMLLAAARGEYHNMVSPGVSVLALVAFGGLDWRTRAESAWRALVLLIGLSVAIGLVDSAVVEPNRRSFLRVLYDGRLYGVLQTPNVLGESAVLLAILSFTVKRGRARTAGIGLAVFGVVAASSQTAAAAVGVALAGWAIWRIVGSAGLLLSCWAAVTGLTGLVAWMSMRPYGPLKSISELWSGVTFSDRTNVWALLLSQHVPFTGLGQDALTKLFSTNVIVGAAGVSSAHNVGLDAYMRDGWIGVIAVALAFCAVLRFVVARRAPLALAAVSAFVLESALEVTPSHVPYFALFFTAIVAAGSRRDAVEAVF